MRANPQAESAQTVAEMQKLHQELLQQLEELQEENAGVREALRLALSEGRQRDNLLLRNRQLESARHFDRVAADRELRSLQTVHNKELLTMQAFISTTNTLMKEHDETKTMLTDAESKASALYKKPWASIRPHVPGPPARLPLSLHPHGALRLVFAAPL